LDRRRRDRLLIGLVNDSSGYDAVLRLGTARCEQRRRDGDDQRDASTHVYTSNGVVGWNGRDVG